MKHSLIIFTTSLVVFVSVLFSGAYAVLRCEASVHGADIVTYSDALWWALNICSVGDANFSPITGGGRMVGALLIIVGYACFTINVGLISALITHLIHRKLK